MLLYGVPNVIIRKSIAGKNKMDAKFFVFGETGSEDEKEYFAGRIKIIVRDTLAAILAIAEVTNTLYKTSQATFFHH